MADATSGPNLTRRALLRVGALAGGGLILGLALPAGAKGASESPETRADPPGSDAATELVPNAWIRIQGDGRIQLMLARSEMGQGVMTSLPMLLAEELEVELEQIQVEIAPVDSAYDNRLLGEQATGESTSMRDAWTTLREAGAVARTLMIAAAAATWGAAVSDCQARRGRVHHADGTRSLSYADLASTASRLPVPQEVALKPKDAWTLIGTVQRRLDTPEKVLGKARFGLDVRLPRMLYATVERCPVVGSRVDTWRAEVSKQVPGVVEVIAVRQGIAVVAESTWAALTGRERLAVSCRPSSNPGADTDRIRERLRVGLTGRAAVAHREGDVSAALASSAREIEAVYELPYQAHACMEPMNCTADVRADGCDIHVPTQAQRAARETAGRITGLPPERIQVHTTFLGGGYGRRREQDFVVDAVELSKRLGRPVQVFWTRADDLRHDFYQPMTLHRLRGGLDARGDLVAWFHRVVGPSVLSRQSPASVREGVDPIMIAGAVDIPYPIPHLRVEFRRADSPVPVGFWRGGGHAHNGFVTECFLDELAKAAGKDPLAMRQSLLASSPRHLRLLERIAERADWGGAPSPGRGRGIALVDAFGSLIALVAEVSIDADRVLVHRLTGVVDCGQAINPDTVRAQIEGGIVFGLTATLKGEISLTDGRVEQGSFGDYPLLRFDEMPEVDLLILDSDDQPGGVSGLGTVATAPAVANALFALSGNPVRSLPIRL